MSLTTLEKRFFEALENSYGEVHLSDALRSILANIQDARRARVRWRVIAGTLSKALATRGRPGISADVLRGIAPRLKLDPNESKAAVQEPLGSRTSSPPTASCLAPMHAIATDGTADKLHGPRNPGLREGASDRIARMRATLEALDTPPSRSKNS